MNRVAVFAAGLAAAFVAAFFAGSALPVGERTVAEAAGHGEMDTAPAGLAVAQDGYRLVQERGTLAAGLPRPYVFRILASDGTPLRDYEVEHERRLHLIVVSRPLGHFLHLHPRLRSDGAWTVPLRLPQTGSYRVFADFTTGGERRTLGIDLQGTGRAAATPASSPYDVVLDRHGDELEFTLTRDGQPVRTQPYLGARGHLVVLRHGDLAYIHAHAAHDRLAFEVPFPSSGEYRLYLQFKVGGKVETVSTGVRQ